MGKKEDLHCIDCCHCDMNVDLEHGSHYQCQIKGKRLPDNVIHRPPCHHFKKQVPPEHWGP